MCRETITPESRFTNSKVALAILLTFMAATAGCDRVAQRPDGDEAVGSVSQIVDPIPYQVDMTCKSETVSDDGPTPSSDISSALPGHLRLGMTIDEISKTTEWRFDGSFNLDGATWSNIEMPIASKGKSLSLSGQVVDVDADGRIDWIKVMSGTVQGNAILARIVESLKGGRKSQSDRSAPAHCTYDRRETFGSAEAPSDVIIGESSYCAAQMNCRISDQVLCVRKPPQSPTLVVDWNGSFMTVTLQGHGLFKPAWTETSPAKPIGKICHSWRAERPYL